MGWRMTSNIIKAPWPRFVLVLIASVQLVKGRVVSDWTGVLWLLATGTAFLLLGFVAELLECCVTQSTPEPESPAQMRS